MRLNKIFEEQLAKISLSDSEIKAMNKVSKDFVKSMKVEGLNAYIGGSFAKGTSVKKDSLQDIDIFVVFKSEKEIKRLGSVLKKINFDGFLKKVHGSRDYYQIIRPEVVLEIVPVVKNTDPSKANNVTDVSLSHVKYVRKKTKESPKLINEIKLAKSFVRANRCYGAESYINGFSGYSLELLIIYFGGFGNFLKKIGKVDVIDMENYFKSKKQIMMELNSSKLRGPLVLVDPTYKFRNVCAGLGQESYDKFVEIAKDFLKSPDISYFSRKNIDILELRRIANKNKARYVEMELECKKQEGDVAGSKMRKFTDFIVSEMKRHGQEVVYNDFEYFGFGGISKAYFVVKEKNVAERRGPPVNLKQQSNSFKKVNGNTVFIKKGFLWVKINTGVKLVLDNIEKFEKEMSVKIRKLVLE